MYKKNQKIALLVFPIKSTQANLALKKQRRWFHSFFLFSFRVRCWKEYLSIEMPVNSIASVDCELHTISIEMINFILQYKTVRNQFSIWMHGISGF